MKKYFKIKAIAILTITVFAFGCKKITDINVSPNDPPLSVATPQILFPSGVASTAGRVGGQLNILGGFWSQYYTQSTLANQFRDIDSYNVTKSSFNADYNELFAGALQDYQLTITQAKAKGEWNYVLMATVMKAYTYGILVDLYDKVPYSQALQGQKYTQPIFDDGKAIYTGLIAEMDAALAQDYNVPLNDEDAATDFVFGGGADAMANWAQFAHTLELKMYLRMVNADPAAAQAGVAKLYVTPDFLDVDAGMTNFVDAPNKDNPFYEYNQRSLNTKTNIKASATFTSFLIATADPRTAKLFGSATPSSINQGDYQSTNPVYATAVNPKQTPTDPVWFISAAESHFLQAEALVRYSGGVGAQAEYLAGIDASFAANNVTSTDAATFTAGSTNPNVNYTASTDKIQTIIVQKWVSLAQGCHTLEAFFEHQRTGFPQVSAVYSTAGTYVPGQWVYSKAGVTPGGAFPKRLIFPASESERNKNTPAAVPITTPVWWALSTN